jgi:hypothetical protein
LEKEFRESKEFWEFKDKALRPQRRRDETTGTGLAAKRRKKRKKKTNEPQIRSEYTMPENSAPSVRPCHATKETYLTLSRGLALQKSASICVHLRLASSLRSLRSFLTDLALAMSVAAI